MKIYEIEAGQKQPLTTDAEKFFSLIDANCTEVIAAMRTAGDFLYRGLNHPDQLTAFQGRSRNNRQSMAFPNEVQEKVDNQLIANGFTAIRANSIFCSGDLQQAKIYSQKKGNNLYIIFPIDGFKFTWATKVADLLRDLRRDMSIDERFVGYYGYRQDDLAAAIKSHNEIMIHGEYYAFRYDTYSKALWERYLK